MKRRFRLTKSTDFQRVRRYGKSYAHPLLVLLVLPNEQDELRIGIAVGRAIGNAVRRNRIKRQIRASVQARISSVKLGWDVLLIARKPVVDAGFQRLDSCLETLFSRAQLLREEVC